MNFTSKRQKILRWISGILLVSLICMVAFGLWTIDLQKEPMFFLWYFTGAIFLAFGIFFTCFLELWEIRKNLKESIIEDQHALIFMLKQACEREAEMEAEKKEKEKEDMKESQQSPPFNPNPSLN